MSGFLAAKIAQFLPKNLTNRATIRSIFIQKLNDFIYREIPPDLIRASLKGMIELANQAKERFDKGILFYGGDEIMPISAGDFLFYCVPLGWLG